MQHHVPEVIEINMGYIASPVNTHTLKEVVKLDAWVQDHEKYDWPEYSVSYDIYPKFLILLADLGIAFIWEYVCTEDFSYYAYNFPTEESTNNLVFFKTGDRGKKIPFLSKKKIKQIENQSAANELLYQLGIRNHGFNKTSP